MGTSRNTCGCIEQRRQGALSTRKPSDIGAAKGDLSNVSSGSMVAFLEALPAAYRAALGIEVDERNGGLHIKVGGHTAYYTTGWRDASDDLLAGWELSDTAGSCRIIRENNSVTLSARLQRTTSGPMAGTRVISLTAGFRFADFVVHKLVKIGSQIGELSSTGSRGRLDVDDISGTWEEGDTLYFTVSWDTDQPKPSLDALPGTAG